MVTEGLTTSGIDGTMQPNAFQPPVNTAPPMVSGTPAVGDALTCSPGSWTGTPPPTFTYRWLRDGAPIAGASESGYTAQGVDEGHSVSCEVIATVSAMGYEASQAHTVSASVVVASNSPIGAPPGPTLPTETTTDRIDSPTDLTTPLVTFTVSKLVVTGSSAPVRVACSQAICQGSIELVVQVVSKGHDGKSALARRATLILATGSFALAEGHSRTVVLRLTVAGRKMLAHATRHHPIAARLTLSVKGGRATTREVVAI
jgi:hypothetical protein